jgi:molecular chaperone DnaK (HSP70)
VPGRLVASAKSWLSHPQVDRMAPILPWGAEADVAKVSPVAASASYLAHLRSAWNARFPAQPLEKQQIVLTIPASFDEGARALTLEAARMAGLPSLRLLEEPQAAFYDWLFRQRASLGEQLADTRLVLVCDVGGGTTDFSLMKVNAGAAAQPAISRIGVGNHLILGGDNMDLALAHLVESRMGGGEPARLSASRLSQLAERCRAAKELLLAADAPERTTVTLLGSGSKLIGGSRSAELTRDEVAALVVDGFFPLNDRRTGQAWTRRHRRIRPALRRRCGHHAPPCRLPAPARRRRARSPRPARRQHRRPHPGHAAAQRRRVPRRRVGAPIGGHAGRLAPATAARSAQR